MKILLNNLLQDDASQLFEKFSEHLNSSKLVDYFNEENSFYFISLFGNRPISIYSKLFYKKNVVMNVYGGLSNDDYDKIVNVIISRNKYKWDKLLDSIDVSYDPLKPFNVTLSETSTNTLETVKDKTSYSEKDKTYGFNSTAGVDTDEHSNSTDREYKRENPTTRDYTRIGNIGNTSFQDLIEKERNVSDFSLLTEIFNDIAGVLTAKIY